MSHKFFTVEEADSLIGFLETTLERIKRNRQRFLWLQEEISILKVIVECGANTPENKPKGEGINEDTLQLEEKLQQFKAVEKEIEKGKAAITNTGCIIRDEDHGMIDFFSIQNNTVVYLCWRKGEDSVRYWHSIHDDFDSRQPLMNSPST
ncbi:MAG: DUF2203 domain-containing protein [Candidatus Latescibacterota bacterium]|jgi:hypothetical protein